MYRFFVSIVVLMWVVAMATLVVRDVLPEWTAQDPPKLTNEKLAQFGRVTEQFGIIDKDGERVGTAWRDVHTNEDGSTIDGWIQLNKIGFIPACRVRTMRRFDAEGALEAFELEVLDLDVKIRAVGERSGIFFPCELQVGHIRRTARLDVSASRMIGESMQPFTVLPELKVGQSWRMQMLDPISAVMNRQTNFRAVIAQVVDKETITSPLDGKPVECFIVTIKAHGAKAWVVQDGRVLRQEVNMPMLGRVAVESEKFKPEDYEDMRKGPAAKDDPEPEDRGNTL